MAAPLLVDTDVMIDYLRGQPQAVSFVRKRAGRIILSSITVAELYAGVRGDAERAAIDDLVEVLQVIPLTVEIAKVGGLLKRTYGKSYGIGLADAIIAATADAAGARLCTLNVKHFPMRPGLKPLYAKK